MALDLSSDFAGWLGSPVRRNRTPNAVGLIEPNANGLQDSFGDVVYNNAARRALASGRRPSLTNPSGVAGGGRTSTPRFSLLSLSKDPAADPLLDNALTGLGRRSGENNAALTRFNLALGRNDAVNQQDIGQESDSVDNVFNGRLGERIGASTAAYRSEADASNAADAAALKAIRDKYGVDQAAAIKLLYGNLGAQRDKFKADVLGDIGNEVARRGADLQNFGAAARVSTDQSIADATRENKAQFGQEGGGGSSYAARLGMGQRIRANTALTQALAELRMGNTEKELARRGELTGQLGALERGDIAGEGQAGIGLNSDLNAQDYRNLGANIGRRQNIEDTVGSRDLAAIQYEQGQRMGALGARAGLRRGALADMLGGINANQAFDSGEIRNLGALGEVRRNNRFLGIDDGTGDAISFPRIPNFNRRGGYSGGDSGYFSDTADGGGSSRPVRPASVAGQDTTQAEVDFFNRYGEWPYGEPPAQLYRNNAERNRRLNPVPLRPEERFDGRYRSDYIQLGNGYLGDQPYDNEYFANAA